MDVTIRFDGATNEYGARDSSGKLVGSCYFLKEHEGGCWKWEVKGGPAGIAEHRETALLELGRACTKKLSMARVTA